MEQGIKKGDTIKFVGDVADAFPKLQRQVATCKGSLTKALTAMEKQAGSYGSLSNEEELLTSQRYARAFIESVEKVRHVDSTILVHAEKSAPNRAEQAFLAFSR